MNLAELLSNLPSLAELQQLALVFSTEVNEALVASQSSLPPNRQHQIQAIQLIDGRWLLGADLLSEIGETGIYKNGFDALPSEYFSQVSVMDWSEAVVLIPQPTGDMI